MKYRVTIEYDVDGKEYDAAFYEVTEEQADAIQNICDEFIRPEWSKRSHVPS